MDRTECGATVVSVMKRGRRKSGPALIEYAFLMVLLATITFAVAALAGNQLSGLYSEVTCESTPHTDATTLAPDGTTLSPGAAAAGTTSALGSRLWWRSPSRSRCTWC